MSNSIKYFFTLDVFLLSAFPLFPLLGHSIGCLHTCFSVGCLYSTPSSPVIGVHLAQLQEEECAYHFVKHSCLLRLQLISAAEKTAAALFLIYSTSCSRVAERKRGEGEERKVSVHMGENLLHNKPKIQTKIKRDGR